MNPKPRPFLTDGFRCGVATPKGPCKQRVAYEGFRCQAHPPTTPEDKKVYRENLRRIREKQNVADEARYAQQDFVGLARAHGLDDTRTRDAYAKWMSAIEAAKVPPA